MAKKNSISIVTVWSWLINLFDTNILTSSEQLVLIHLIKFINRNFWKPIKIEPQIIAKSTNKDNRTVKKALTSLINKNFVTFDEKEGYFIGITNQPNDNNENHNNQQHNQQYFNFAETDS